VELMTPLLVRSVAKRACVVANSMATPVAAAGALEAATLLSNMLKIDREKAGRALTSPDSSPVSEVIALLAAAPNVPLFRVRHIAQIAFQLSLLPVVSSGSQADAFAGAVRSALAWASATTRYPSPAEHTANDVAQAGGTAADLCRATFNMLRASSNDGSTNAKKTELVSLLSSMADLLHSPSTDEEVVEAKLACLQLGVVMPKEIAYPKLESAWKPLTVLLPGLFLKARQLSDTNAPVLPVLTLQYIAETGDPKTREAIRADLFPPEWLTKELSPKDPYKPAGLQGDWDPNTPLSDDAPVHMWLLQALTCTNHTLKHVVGDFLYALGGDDASEFVRLVGLGSAAGLLQERDMFSAFQQMAEAGQVQYG